jgi:hypothetical protein
MVEGLIWLFSLASGRIAPVDCDLRHLEDNVALVAHRARLRVKEREPYRSRSG